MHDDLGHELALTCAPRRVVSLVPSLTEAIDASAPGTLVGATDWCTHPGDLDVARVRGTKNPDVAAIVALAPDLVVANEEENRRIDVERLRAEGVPVWVTRIGTVAEALGSLDRLLAALAAPERAWLGEAQQAWASPASLTARVAVPIWRDPWRWVGHGTYADDVLARVGARNVVADPRYPAAEPGEVAAKRPDVVLLPDEPYAFSTDDGPDALPGCRCVPVDGRALFWYGPAMVAARARLEAALRAGTESDATTLPPV